MEPPIPVILAARFRKLFSM